MQKVSVSLQMQKTTKYKQVEVPDPNKGRWNSGRSRPDLQGSSASSCCVSPTSQGVDASEPLRFACRFIVA